MIVNGHGVVAQPIQFGLPRQSAQDQPLDPAAIEEYIAEAIEDLLGHQNGPGHDSELCHTPGDTTLC